VDPVYLALENVRKFSRVTAMNMQVEPITRISENKWYVPITMDVVSFAWKMP
jgi:hypothetical protein